MLTEPSDFVGNILAKMISKALDDSKLRKRIGTWKMIVTLESDYYPVSMVFDKGISVVRGREPNPTLIVNMDFGTVIELVEGNTSMVRAMLRRKIRVRGLVRHLRSTLRFYQLMNAILGA